MYVISILTFMMVFVSCSRKAEDSKTSILSINTPSGGIGSLAALPVGRKVCYGVSVMGPGIPSTPAQTCKPEMGLIAGFVEPGAAIQLSVPRGSDRRVDLYLYLKASGDNSTCPGLMGAFTTNELGNVYYMGSATGVSLSQDSESVTINATFPGEGTNIVAQKSYPSSCSSSSNTASGPTNYRVFSGSSVATGGSMKLFGRAGNPSNPQSLVGGGIKLQVRQLGK